MNSLTCEKCKTKFNSVYLLKKHMNRKYPCDLVFRCEKCNKVFKYMRDLDSHKNRKNPCDKKNVELRRIALEEQKILARKEARDQEERMREKEIAAKKEAKEREEELTRFKIAEKKEAKERELELRKLEVEIREKEIQARKELEIMRANTMLELARLKIEASQQIELSKNERKLQTPQIINNIQHITTINNYKLIIEERFLDDCTTSYTQLKDICDKFYKELQKNKTEIKKLFEQGAKTNFHGMLVCIFSCGLKNNSTHRDIFHFRPDHFFGISISGADKSVKEIEYKHDVLDILKPLAKDVLSLIRDTMPITYLRSEENIRDPYHRYYNQFMEFTTNIGEIHDNSFRKAAEEVLLIHDS